MTISNRTEVHFDAKRRTVVPADMLRAAGLDTGQSLVLVAEPGRIVIQTPEAAQARLREQVWSMFPSDAVDDAVRDVRAMRDDDIAISDHNAAARSAVAAESAADERGKALLAALDL